MILSACLKYKTEMICDLAEVYGIHDWRQYPPGHIATLIAGLGAESRTKRKLSGVMASQADILLATIADRLGYILCAMTGTEDPLPSIYDAITGQTKEETREYLTFSSPDDFVRKYKQLGGKAYG